MVAPNLAGNQGCYGSPKATGRGDETSDLP